MVLYVNKFFRANVYLLLTFKIKDIAVGDFLIVLLDSTYFYVFSSLYRSF